MPPPKSVKAGVVFVKTHMENLESYGVLRFRFPGSQSYGIWKVMESENNCMGARVSLLLLARKEPKLYSI